ncbi:hypothetical protein WJ977_31740 [Achromobacter xylosoxidans]
MRASRPSAVALARSTTRPASVNLTALLTRLLRICRMRIESPSAEAGMPTSVMA